MRTWFALGVSAFCCVAVADAESGAALREARRAATWVLADGTVAVPLVRDAPEWYTPEVEDKTRQAARDGLAYDYEADRSVSPASAPSQILIRPGTQLLINGGMCTAGFVYGGRDKIATAGHCTRAKGDSVVALAAPALLAEIGKVSDRSLLGDGPGGDWALIDIDPMWERYTDADVAIVGGPCGKVENPATPLLKHVGHGFVVGTGGTARLAVHTPSGPYFTAYGAANRGDSGAPVLEVVQTSQSGGCASGGAIGILTHVRAIDVSDGTGIGTGVFFGTWLREIPGSLSDGDLLPLTP